MTKIQLKKFREMLGQKREEIVKRAQQTLDQDMEQVTRAMHVVAGEARTIEGRLSQCDWLVGEQPSAADMVVYPGIMLLLRAMEKREAGDLRSRLLPMATTYPAIDRWIKRMEQLPGYERTYPPHWREGPPRG